MNINYCGGVIMKITNYVITILVILKIMRIFVQTFRNGKENYISEVGEEVR